MPSGVNGVEVFVVCRIGSLEKLDVLRRDKAKVVCRIGSLETDEIADDAEVYELSAA